MRIESLVFDEVSERRKKAAGSQEKPFEQAWVKLLVACVSMGAIAGAGCGASNQTGASSM